MRDELFTDPDEELDDTDEVELGFEDDLVAEIEADNAADPIANGDENAVGIVLDEHEADESEAGGMEQFACAYCGEPNEVFVDRTASKRQQFTEDCEICCRPNLVSIFLDPDGGVWVDAEQEDDA